jgi:hypothetical protein
MSYLNGEVGQHRAQHPHQPLDVVATASGKGITGVMADIVRGDEFVDDGQISLTPQLLAPTADDRFVLLNGHRCPSGTDGQV